MIKVNWKDKEFIAALCKESYSLSQVLKKLGLNPMGSNPQTLKFYILKYDIDCSHFTGKLWSKGKALKPDLSNYKDLKSVRRQFINLTDYKCVDCGNEGVHNGKKLVLHLDHIDGNRFNNSFDNLRLLCPNCHTQTPTYCRKKPRLNVAINKQ